jgi:hypothetical protein
MDVHPQANISGMNSFQHDAIVRQETLRGTHAANMPTIVFAAAAGLKRDLPILQGA